MRLFGDRSADRRRRAALYVRALHADPAPADVEWLAAVATGGDADHAAWEWRYARLALGQLVAQRNALDDLTPSIVAQEIGEALSRDPRVAVGMLPLAQRQFQERLSGYRDALASRSGEGTGARVARILLAFSGTVRPKPDVLMRAGETLAAHLEGCGAALETAFGASSLPDDVPPSAVARPH